MHIKKIIYCEPNMSQPPGEREWLEQVGYVVMENNQQISGIFASAAEADEWYDEYLMLDIERGD